MIRAGLEGDDFYFYDKNDNKIEVFSIGKVPEEDQGLPLDCLKVSKGQSRRETLLHRLLLSLRGLGDGGEYTMGQSLLLLSLVRRLNETGNFGDVLLLGEEAASSVAQSLANIMECFSLHSRLYCLGGTAKDKYGGRNSIISLPQDYECLVLPDGRFDGVIISDGKGIISREILDKALLSIIENGYIFCLASTENLKQYFMKIFPKAEQYYMSDSLTLYCQTVHKTFLEKRYKLAYPGFANNQIKAVEKTSKKKIVLFMPYLFDQWENMQPLYEKLKEDKENCTVLIMPIPYGEKDENGAVVKEEYEGKNFPPEYDVLDFWCVDLSKLHADVIVLDHPYSSNAEYEVDNQHYAESICNFTDKVICLSEINSVDACLRGGDILDTFPAWRPIILYGGATWQAEKCYYQLHESEQIVYFANKESAGKFHGKKIVALKDIVGKEKFIILVATKWPEFQMIKSELERQGLVEFIDFWYWEAYVKKIAVVHGNCYGNSYIEFLLKSQEFTGEYFIYPSPLLHVNKSGRLDDRLIQVCDLFIHQDIRKENEFGYYFSDEYIRSKLKFGCKELVVPNLVPYADVIFPRSYVTDVPERNLTNFLWGNKLFIGNRIIDDAFQKGMDIDGIVEDFMDVNIASESEKQKCRDHFNDRIANLKQREEKWDVKISDYILKYYKDYKLFSDTLHPSRVLMLEICRRMGKALNLKDIGNIQLDSDYECIEMFVMPWVKDALGLKFSDDFVRTNNRLGIPNSNKLGDGKMDLREYIREYIYWKYGDFLD